MNGYMDSGSMVLPSSQEFSDRDDPGAPQPHRTLQAQAPGLDCHLPGDGRTPGYESRRPKVPLWERKQGVGDRGCGT